MKNDRNFILISDDIISHNFVALKAHADDIICSTDILFLLRRKRLCLLYFVKMKTSHYVPSNTQLNEKLGLGQD